MKLVTLLCSLALCACAQDDVPKNLKPPAGQKVLLSAHGAGEQIYACRNSGSSAAWVLRAPSALLTSDQNQIMGHHFAGPTWEWNDKSSVTGKVMATAPSPAAAIPWLLLTAVKHEGDGVFSGVASIQRINTKGGLAPTSGCDADHLNTELRIPYEADYVFFGK